MKKIMEFIQNWGMRLALFSVIIGITGFMYLKKTGALSPGELSDFHPNNVPINGVMSHADMEKDCGHCHGPIHCVIESKCQDCHQDVAADRNDPTTMHGRLPGVNRCQECHPEHQGEDSVLTLLAFENVDHYLLSGYSLITHQRNYDDAAFTCSSCHRQDGKILETLDCVTCHSNANHDDMVVHIEAYGLECQACHDGKDRMMVEGGFDHEPYYALNGGHADQDCTDCHTEQVYAGMSSDCATCHEEPEIHAGVFGTNCAMCHTDLAWAPAQLREHNFLMSHDDNDTIETCETCHGGSYTTYPCDTCHATADMELAHVEVETENLHDCISCHPTGRNLTDLTITETETVGEIPDLGTAPVTDTTSSVVLTSKPADQRPEQEVAAEEPAEVIAAQAVPGNVQKHGAPKNDQAKRSGRGGEE